MQRRRELGSGVSRDLSNDKKKDSKVPTQGSFGSTLSCWSTCVELSRHLFRLVCPLPPFLLQDKYISADIESNASAWDMLSVLESMPNIGTVDVEKSDSGTLSGSDVNSTVWTITFTSEVGELPSLEVHIVYGKQSSNRGREQAKIENDNSTS